MRASFAAGCRHAPLAIPDALAAELAAAYGEPQRAYHDARHVGEVLAWFDVVADEVGWAGPAEAFVAILFHDAICDVARKDNEARSRRPRFAPAGARSSSGSPRRRGCSCPTSSTRGSTLLPARTSPARWRRRRSAGRTLPERSPRSHDTTCACGCSLASRSSFRPRCPPPPRPTTPRRPPITRRGRHRAAGGDQGRRREGGRRDAVDAARLRQPDRGRRGLQGHRAGGHGEGSGPAAAARQVPPGAGWRARHVGRRPRLAEQPPRCRRPPRPCTSSSCAAPTP